MVVAVIDRRTLLGAGLATAGLSACAVPYGRRGSYAGPVIGADQLDTATWWIDVLVQQARDSMLAPPRVAYCLAGPTVAGFVAANAVAGRYADNFGLGRAPAGADPEVAYGAAFATLASEVLLTPLTTQRLAFMDRHAPSEAKTLGAEWGRKVGLHFAKLRTFDGSGATKVGYYFNTWPKRSDALAWTPTGEHYAARPGPAFDDYQRGLFPGHGRIKPWGIKSAATYLVEPFCDAKSPEFAEEFHLLHTMGGATSAVRSADQANIAIFWEDGPWGATTPGHMAIVAMQVLAGRGFDFIDKARAYALFGMGQCDASIICWRNKYQYSVLRPETAIRLRADAFGNTDRRVVRDAGWRTLIPTPNFPSYTAGHSTMGAAAARVLARVIGTDTVSFSHEAPDQVIWPALRGMRRSYTALSAMAEENGMSRIYGGVHWLRDHVQATRNGYALGDHLVATWFNKAG